MSEQQHPAAFGIDGMVLPPGGEGIEAAAALAQLRSMLFWKSAGDDDAAGFDRQRFIGEGAPGQNGHAETLEQVFGFGVAEVEGVIGGYSDRQS